MTGKANGKPLGWVIGTAYKKDDVVTFDDKLYKATRTSRRRSSTPRRTRPTGRAPTARTRPSRSRSSSPNAKSQLSGTSTISAATGNVTISSNLKTNITTEADATLSKSGAAFAVGVSSPTRRRSSTAPLRSRCSRRTSRSRRDTNNASPTTGKASPSGSNDDAQGGTGKNPNSPSTEAMSTSDAGTIGGNAAASKGDGMSKTSDGDQPVAAAFGVTVLVATTKAYVASADGSRHGDLDHGGTDLLHAGSTNSATSTADAGNVKFAPDD